jgi:acetolactate synthase I/II/III large subunit
MSGRITFPTFSDELAHELAEIGIRDAFLVTGGAVAPLTSALVRQGKIRMHYMLTEQSAGIAAEAYGYFDGKPALLIVTSGPGVTNALTPIAAAWTNSAPVFVISGQARSGDVELATRTTSRQIGNQHLRTDRLVESIVKKFLELKTPSDCHEIVSTLHSEAISNRPGPVWLSVPQDIQRGPCASGLLSLKTSEIQNMDEVLFKRVVLENLSTSKSPAILVGAGARLGIDSIKVFASNFNIPILTTWPGMDLMTEADELYCGRPGSIPSTWSPNLINVEADFLMVFGARLDLGQVGYNPTGFAPNATVIRIDIDEEEFTRVPPRKNWYNFCSSTKNTSAALLEISSRELKIDFSEWWIKISHWKKAYPRPRDIDQEFYDGVSSYHLIHQVSQTFSGRTIVTGSSGTCMEMLLQSWQVQEGQRIINSCGLGSMGFAIPAAIGIGIKTGESEVICIESDGSFAMNLQDLVTMKSLSTSFKVIVMDSSGYKSISLSQSRLQQLSHGNNEQTNLALPNILKIAQTIGFNVRIVEQQDKILSSLEWLESQTSSSLLVVKVSATEDALPRLISKPNLQGVMETPPDERSVSSNLRLLAAYCNQSNLKT